MSDAVITGFAWISDLIWIGVGMALASWAIGLAFLAVGIVLAVIGEVCSACITLIRQHQEPPA